MTRRPAFFIALIFSLLLVLPACQTQDLADAPIIVTREPLPTPDPGIVGRQVSEAAEAAGLADTVFLGLGADDWINFGLSILLVLIGYAVIVWLLNEAYKVLGRLTSGEMVATTRAQLNRPLRWATLLILLRFAIARLVFLPLLLRQVVLDALFIATMAVVTLILWRVIDLSIGYYRSLQTDSQRLVELDPALVLISRVSRIVLVVSAISLVLSYFGINVTALTAALGVGALGLSLAARDVIADAIAGVIILFERPFRVGDRIEIQELGTWGDVVEIGLRTTRMRTRDNRMVIVPNAAINNNQIVNYSYPDPRYRIETHVNVAYGSDVEQVRQVVYAAVSQLEGVLPDKPVDVLYDEMGDSAMIFRVRLWIRSYEDTRRMADRVNTSLQAALNANGIRIPYQTVTLKLDSEQKAPAAGGDSAPSSPPEQAAGT